jgi:sulfite exporter TauE/SafE/copper chaperone CopZ
MTTQPTNEVTAQFRILGTHCGSCEILLERKLRSVPGITHATVNHRTGKTTIRAQADHPPAPEEIERVIRDAGYRLDGSDAVAETSCAVPADTNRKWLEIGASLLIVFALYKILSAFHLVSLVPTASGALSLGGIFVIGLVAGTSSCLAVTGGLLLAVAAKYNEAHQSETSWQKFKPLLQFSIGRLASYLILGGVVGLLGQAITFNARITAGLNLVIALVMLSIALSLLQILPKGKFGIRPPKALSHWIANLSENPHPLAPFGLGALTFFLPCGFTQSLQLVALASGSFVTGAVTMFTFALGTMPSLLGISAISSTAKGTTSRLFLRFAGTVVLVLSLFNLNSALALSGIDLSAVFAGPVPTQGSADVPQVANGVQEVNMKVTSYGYEPSNITLKAGVPVRWVIDGTQAGGCTSGIIVPSLNISRTLQAGANVIEIPAQNPGRIPFSCSMGMVRGSFTVI